jgi:ribonuclease P protein component
MVSGQGWLPHLVGLCWPGEEQRADTELLFKRPDSLKSRKTFVTSRHLPASDRGCFLFKVIPGSKPELGVIVTKKTGGAVARNYIKRRLKHAFWEAWSKLENRPNSIWIVIARKEVANIRFEKLVSLFGNLLSN